MIHDEEPEIPNLTPAEALSQLEGVFQKGDPAQVLENPAEDFNVSESLIVLFEEEELPLLHETRFMTPDWSLYVRRFLESYSEEVEKTSNLVSPMDTGGPFLYGFGLLVDGVPEEIPAMEEDRLKRARSIISDMLASMGDRPNVQLHPNWGGISDLYLFSFEERRNFFESFFAEGPGEEPAYLRESGYFSEEGFWGWQPEAILGPDNPILSHYPFISPEGEGVGPITLVGAFSSSLSPGEGGVQDRLERMQDDASFQGGIRRLSELFVSENGSGSEGISVSLVPWSYLLPMAISLSLVQKIIEFLETIQLSGRETFELVPFWEKGFLWLHGSIKGRTETREFLLIDEYVWEFVENMLPALLENHLPLKAQWHPLPGEDRENSLGLL